MNMYIYIYIYIYRHWEGSEHAHTHSYTHTWCSHQVHGGAARRMGLDEQLRWRLSNALDLCLHGLQRREREKKTKDGEM